MSASPNTDHRSLITGPPAIPPGASLADDLRGAMHGWLSRQRPRDAAEREGLMAAWKAGADAAVTEMRLRLDRLPSGEAHRPV